MSQISPAPTTVSGDPSFGRPRIGELLAGLTMTIGRRPVARLAIDAADLHVGDHVVDIGCGPGVALREAARRGIRATGVDPAPGMLHLARRLTRARSRRHRLVPAPTLLEGRAEALPLPDACADAAWALHSAHHWNDVPVALAEARRVLAPGGRLVIVERLARPGSRFAHHAIDESYAAALARDLEAAGFEHVKVSPLTAGPRRVVVVRGTRSA